MGISQHAANGSAPGAQIRLSGAITPRTWQATPAQLLRRERAAMYLTWNKIHATLWLTVATLSLIGASAVSSTAHLAR